MPEPTPAPLPRFAAFARVALVLTAAWILTGAIFKLLIGTPNDLPPVLFELVPLSKGMIYHLAIAAELVIVALAFTRPRLGWWLCAATMVVFDLILVQLIASGAKSCGCFGGKIEMPPERMMLIDSVLLVALLASRPWRVLTWKGLETPVVAVIALALASVPWLFDRSTDLGPIKPVKATPTVANADAQSQPATPVVTPTKPATETATPPPAEPKPGLRNWVSLDAPKWVGKSIAETELAQLLDVNLFDQNCTWVLWRWRCDHCAQHLEEMARTYDGATPLVLIRIPETGDTDQNGAVKMKPTGPLVLEATLSPELDYVVTTPVVLVLNDGVIVSAVENPGR
ncbi:MAG: hypothetical protein EPO68_05570 [Planctomycetota bacterium]|nr:MAG: hypothetical protein EPO68_05570 [Planctomycetota bacterium]